MPTMTMTCAARNSATAKPTPMAKNSAPPMAVIATPIHTSVLAPWRSNRRPAISVHTALTTPPGSMSMPASVELLPSPRCSSCGTRYMNARVQANEQLTMRAGVRNAAMPRARRSSSGSAMCSWR